MKRILWWVCLLLAPAVLIGLELFHPANFTNHPGMYQYLSQAEPHSAAHHGALDYFGPRWWLVLHMIQTPMVGLVAVGLLLMVDDIGDEDGAAAVAAVWLARAAIFVMVIYGRPSPPRCSLPRPCCCRAAPAGPTWRCWWPSAGSCRRPMPRRTDRSPSPC